MRGNYARRTKKDLSICQEGDVFRPRILIRDVGDVNGPATEGWIDAGSEQNSMFERLE